LPDDVPAHTALNCQVNLSLGWPPSSQWHRRPGRPRNRWVDQIRNDNNLPPADLWRRAVSCGHCRASLRPLLAKRWQVYSTQVYYKNLCVFVPLYFSYSLYYKEQSELLELELFGLLIKRVRLT